VKKELMMKRLNKALKALKEPTSEIPKALESLWKRRKEKKRRRKTRFT
jgi:hypothetical protein